MLNLCFFLVIRQPKPQSFLREHSKLENRSLCLGPSGNWLRDQDKKRKLTKPIPYLRDLVDFGRFDPNFRDIFGYILRIKSMKSNLLRKSMKSFFPRFSLLSGLLQLSEQ